MDKQEALKRIQELVQRDTIIYCVARKHTTAHTWIRCYVIRPDGATWLDAMIDSATKGLLRVDRKADALKIRHPGYSVRQFVKEHLAEILGFAPRMEDL